jgi:hypothetical protein
MMGRGVARIAKARSRGGGGGRASSWGGPPWCSCPGDSLLVSWGTGNVRVVVVVGSHGGRAEAVNRGWPGSPGVSSNRQIAKKKVGK